MKEKIKKVKPKAKSKVKTKTKTKKVAKKTPKKVIKAEVIPVKKAPKKKPNYSLIDMSTMMPLDGYRPVYTFRTIKW